MIPPSTGRWRVRHAVLFMDGARMRCTRFCTWPIGPVGCVLSYQLNSQAVIVRLKTTNPLPEKTKISLVVPIISQSGQKIDRVSKNRIEIQKSNGKIAIEANCPLHIQSTGRKRIFNMVPGFEAVPVVADIKFDNGSSTVECKITGV